MKMVVIRGDGRVIKNLDRAGVIKELWKAQEEKDPFTSVFVEREAGYMEAALREYEKKLNIMLGSSI